MKSTSIGLKLGDRKWIGDLLAHSNQARGLAVRYDSYVVKVIGDSLMIAFRMPTQAVDFALEFATLTGVDYIGIMVGIHSGQVQITENDIYGLNVNLAARVQQALPSEGILVTDSVRADYENRFGADSGVRFLQMEIDLKSFGKKTLYVVRQANTMDAIRSQRKARQKLLEEPKVTSWLI